MAVGSTGVLKYFRPVRSSSSSTTPTLPDSDGLLSERVATSTLYVTDEYTARSQGSLQVAMA